MNFPIFITIIFIVFWILDRKYRFIILGKIGELVVSWKLNRLDKTKYRILNDLLLPSNGNINTAQIDHVVVSNYGIFCIETKFMKGWIFGNAVQEYWTQVIYDYKEKFYNPLRQNYKHTEAIKEILKFKYPNIDIISLVVFPAAGKIRVSGTDSVDYLYETLIKIKSFVKPVFSDMERDEIYAMLSDANIIDKNIRKAHIQDVKKLKIDKENY